MNTLTQINAHLQGKDDQVVGVYEVPESLHAKEPASTTSVLARKVADATGKPALLLFVRLLTNAGGWKEAPRRKAHRAHCLGRAGRRQE